MPGLDIKFATSLCFVLPRCGRWELAESDPILVTAALQASQRMQFSKNIHAFI